MVPPRWPFVFPMIAIQEDEAIVMTTTPASTDKQAKLLPFHPLADMFPLIEGKDFDDLVADIKQNGLREEISFVLVEKGGREVEKGGREVIVDGRNRYRACLKAGV